MSTEPEEQPEPTQEETAAAKPELVVPEETLETVTARYEEQLKESKDALLRAMAETENVRRRMQTQIDDMSKYAVTGFARDLVEVVENMQRALGAIPEEARKTDALLNTLGEGVEMTMRQLLAMLQKHGIVRIDPKGQKFNHNHHQAIAQVERSDVEAGTVIEVVQAGYVIHDRLLRPAMVAVAKAPETGKDGASTTA